MSEAREMEVSHSLWPAEVGDRLQAQSGDTGPRDHQCRLGKRV